MDDIGFRDITRITENLVEKTLRTRTSHMLSQAQT